MIIGISAYVCGSCAVGSIANVGGCKNPVDVLKQVCSAELGKLSQFRKEYPKLTCFYVFCAGPEVPKEHPNGSHHSKAHWLTYGTDLARYITENKLGEIVTLGPKFNAKHHPNTTAQVWVWSPNQKAVEKWWEKHQTSGD